VERTSDVGALALGRPARLVGVTAVRIGEVWLAALDPDRHGDRRPIVVPLTGTDRGLVTQPREPRRRPLQIQPWDRATWTASCRFVVPSLDVADDR